MITIRPAIGADAEALAVLRWDFRAGLSPATESRDAFVGRCAAWMRRGIDASVWRCWLAIDAPNGVVVGHVWVQIIDKIPNPVGESDRHAYLSNLFVLTSARGGVGTRLLEAALAWCANERVDRVILWPTSASVSLYERHGFTRAGDVMELTRAAHAS